MSLLTRLNRLERLRDTGSCGPGCPPVQADWGEEWYGQPCVPEPTMHCPRCGRPAIKMHIVFDPDFYGNSELLAEATQTSQGGTP